MQRKKFSYIIYTYKLLFIFLLNKQNILKIKLITYILNKRIPSIFVLAKYV